MLTTVQAMPVARIMIHMIPASINVWHASFGQYFSLSLKENGVDTFMKSLTISMSPPVSPIDTATVGSPGIAPCFDSTMSHLLLLIAITVITVAATRNAAANTSSMISLKKVWPEPPPLVKKSDAIPPHAAERAREAEKGRGRGRERVSKRMSTRGNTRAREYASTHARERGSRARLQRPRPHGAV
eukprot:CAMPEP_0198235544 /NCGR_PEP_ID=MMETSP1446-20131203/1458_1 /TAXON_ID=1461542 ORGANISM="Unidentified sp, Strain CCMP2111" /NCGR_SAMPLE_ID=MMETSP1446 /ASSEMBLY_ACC=CAM_ASM_001112 /LENGTH=185 /DNA_ID=CAMNT_0043916803 /DNA_START=633 /DNA_END=1188 /DNA_ORIENTATION=+